MSEKEIIEIAAEKAGRRGESLELHAGIEFIGINPDADGDFESFEQARVWESGEELKAAITEFTHDGYLYEIFKSGEQDAEFIARATDFSLKDEAIDFVNN